MNLKRLVAYFLRGCLVTAPLGLTIYIVWIVLRTVDTILPFQIPGVGLLVTVGLITLVGVLTSNVVGRSFLDLTESMLRRLPLVKLVYTSIKDLVSAFVGDQKRFDVPVAVTVGSGVKLLGFVTRDGLARIGMPEHVAVYVPQSYNFAGNLMLVPRSQVEALELSPSEVMTFVVSGGVSGFGVGQSILPPEPRPS
jgi:uncharacterized membrane protein